MSTTPRADRAPGLLDPLVVAVGLLALALDQLTKGAITWALGPAAPEHAVEVIGSYIRLAYTTNSGAAFGILPQQTLVFTAIAVAAVPLLLLSRRLIGTDHPLIRFGLGLLLGGTLGNLADRLRLGYVVDFVDVGLGPLRWPSFNLADSCFVVGVVILAAYALFAPAGPAEGHSAARASAAPAGSPGDRADQRTGP